MMLRELITEIKKLNHAEQHRLKEFFINSIASFSASEPLFQEVTERKNKDGYTCVHCGSKQVVRFGTYKVKLGLKEIERQRYRCKDCRKTFTDVTATPLYRTHKPDKWLDFIKCMLEGYSLRKSADIIGDIHFVTLFYWRHKLLSALKQMDFRTFSGIEWTKRIFYSLKRVKETLKVVNLVNVEVLQSFVVLVTNKFAF